MMERIAFGRRSNSAATAWPDQATGAALPNGFCRTKIEAMMSFPVRHYNSLQVPRSPRAPHTLIISAYLVALAQNQPGINTHRPRPAPTV
jgi:hypothetical protein